MIEKQTVSAEQQKKLLKINSKYFTYLKQNQYPYQTSEREKIKTAQPMEPFSEYFQEYKTKKYCRAKKIDPPQDYRDKKKMLLLESSSQADYEDKTNHYLKRPQTACLPENSKNFITFHHSSTYQKQHNDKPRCNVCFELVDEPYQMKLDYPPTVMENMKLNSKTEYQRQFRCITPESDLIFGGKSIFSNPISPKLAMYGQSETHRLFRSMKIKQHKIVEPSLAKKLALDTSLTLSNIPPFQGQYETVSKRDFSEKSILSIPRRYNH